jgi:uncharacterized protein YndB with AHSA1/START domain
MIGELRSDGTIVFRRFYRHAIEHVWDAISTPEGLREWMMARDVTITRDRIDMTSGPAGYRSTGAVLRWVPPFVLEYEWNRDLPEHLAGDRARVRARPARVPRSARGAARRRAAARLARALRGAAGRVSCVDACERSEAK